MSSCLPCLCHADLMLSSVYLLPSNRETMTHQLTIRTQTTEMFVSQFGPLYVRIQGLHPAAMLFKAGRM